MFAFAEIIKDLEQPNPTDPAPGITRAFVSYLRVMETCGAKELMLTIDNNICASLAVLELMAGPEGAEGILTELVRRDATTLRRAKEKRK